MSHKFFCDRCEKEVKQPIDEVGIPLKDNMMLAISVTPHYCNACANHVTSALKEMIDVRKLLGMLEAKEVTKTDIR